MYSAAYGTVHYEEPLKSFEIRVGTLGFLLSRYCHDCAESDVKQYLLIRQLFSDWRKFVAKVTINRRINVAIIT